jgi:hypothetical protein
MDLGWLFCFCFIVMAVVLVVVTAVSKCQRRGRQLHIENDFLSIRLEPNQLPIHHEYDALFSIEEHSRAPSLALFIGFCATVPIYHS